MPDIVLTITLRPNGQVDVNGPVDNALMSYGLLELAKVAITDHNRKKAEGRRIEVPAIMISGDGRRQ